MDALAVVNDSISNVWPSPLLVDPTNVEPVKTTRPTWAYNNTCQLSTRGVNGN
ncbi:hypothetical protein WN55_06343 [Dufourea novaeangliae]|uniref:Uncharacterized protein n=1 Tax=Dufourea novaeangliae TaxID=178035 RepID=A0A154PQC8_DUFNO|nr:hypothetical protein WN55_06343 [Dufourea novaeangliae]